MKTREDHPDSEATAAPSGANSELTEQEPGSGAAGATDNHQPTADSDDTGAAERATASTNADDRERQEAPAVPAGETDQTSEASGTDRVETSEDGIRDLLRGALGKDQPEVPDVLRGVQRKLRQRSRGKFYADAWSTAKQPPINTYLITSLVMLAIVFFVWAVLSPLSGAPASVDPPAPINVVPGQQHREP